MRFLKLLLFSTLLVSCVKCVSVPETTHNEQVELVPQANEPFAILFTDARTAVKINPTFFPKAQAFHIVYKGVFYGLFLADDVIYLPTQAVKEKAKLDIISLDSAGKEFAKRSWYVTRGD